MAGASVSVAVSFVAVATAGVSQSFQTLMLNAAPAEAVRACASHDDSTSSLHSTKCVISDCCGLLLFGLRTIHTVVDTGRYFAYLGT